MKIKIGVFLIIVSIVISLYTFVKFKINQNNYEVAVNNKLLNNDYYAIIEIPKINLKREIYEIKNINNNVDSNILVHKNSIFPGKAKSNVILAAHSGNGKNAYFKNLYKLKTNDTIYLYFNSFKYEYEIQEIEYQNKTGSLYIKEGFDNMITLITCTYNNQNTQTIYYGKLKNIENIAKK